ncbi:hypothetical protein V5799_015403 [Amblyomma americanum]|uniref:Secreted protein n=1 Tax=Amblyomma americanum TaxID=6943 RepID=A0AAQ4F7U3_AMBAM
MAFLSLLVAAYLLMITGSAAGKVIFGPDVFGTSDQCNGTCSIDFFYESNCTDPCVCVSFNLNSGNNRGPGQCQAII